MLTTHMWTYFCKYCVDCYLFNPHNNPINHEYLNGTLTLFPSSNAGFDLIYSHFKNSFPKTIVLEGL